MKVEAKYLVMGVNSDKLDGGFHQLLPCNKTPETPGNYSVIFSYNFVTVEKIHISFSPLSASCYQVAHRH